MPEVKVEPLINAMAQRANTLGVPHYCGDLIHDGALIMIANDGDVFTWVFKGNECGTWMLRNVHEETNRIVRNVLKEESRGPRGVFKITVHKGSTHYDQPQGTIEMIPTGGG